jgi:hypothetical protein
LSAAATFGIGRLVAFLTVGHNLPFHPQVTIVPEEWLIVNAAFLPHREQQAACPAPGQALGRGHSAISARRDCNAGD